MRHYFQALQNLKFYSDYFIAGAAHDSINRNDSESIVLLSKSVTRRQQKVPDPQSSNSPIAPNLITFFRKVNNNFLMIISDTDTPVRSLISRFASWFQV